MLLRCLCCVAIPAILTAFPAGVLAANDADLPKGVTPRLAIVSKIKGPAGTITCSWVVERPVFETKYDDKAGTYQTYKDVPFPQSKTFLLGKAAFQDAKGNRLSRESFESRVKSGDTIVVSADGKPVDQAYMRILKDSVLILMPAPQEVREKYHPPPQPPAMPPRIRQPATPPVSTPPSPAPR